MNRSLAAEEFARMLFQVGVEGGINALFDSLNTPVGVHKQTWEKIKRWHENQTDEVRALFRFAVKEAAVLAVFGIAVHLDGASGYHFIDDRPSEFTISLNVYENHDAAREGIPLETVAICPTKFGEDVHDIFLSVVGEVETENR